MKKQFLIITILLVYFITIQAQVAKEITKTLPLSDTIQIDESYGTSVSVDGNYAVIGVPGYAANTGRAVVLQRRGASWEEIAVLTASDGQSDNVFGTSVSISNNTIVIGSDKDYHGAAYLYEKPDTGWVDMTQTAILSASDEAAFDHFGSAVSISDSTVVIGAYYDDDNGSSSGSAYVYSKPDTGWTNMIESAKLTASDGAANDRFGRSVSISDSIIVIGAPYDDDNGGNSGSVYVFQKPTGGWTDMTQTAKLTTSDGASPDALGWSVCISENTIVAGAYNHTDNGYRSGAAYVFEKPAAGWNDMTQTAKLLPSDEGSYIYFGFSAAISKNTIAVGAHYDYENGSQSGSAYVFQKPVSGWSDMNETAKLTASDGSMYDYLGYAVSISDSTIFAGAYGEDDKGDQSGSTYIFEKSIGSWQDSEENQKLYPVVYKPNLNDNYGYSVAIDNDYAVVGAQNSNGNKGNAYVLHKNSTGWETIATLAASDAEQGDYFGQSVDISGNAIVVGAYQDNDNGTNSGSAYVFEKPAMGWTDTTQTAKLTAADGYNYDYFGASVCISDSTIAVGAYHDDDLGQSSGSVYVYQKPASGWTDNTQTAKLAAADGAENDFFGFSTDIAGNTIVVGACQDSDNGGYSGSAYVFNKPSTGWKDTTQTAKLLASDGFSSDNFGTSICISGNTIVVGSNNDDDNGENSGSAYVFEKPVSGWKDTTQTAKLLASDGGKAEQFGKSVSISDSIIVIGAPYDDDNGGNSGSVYVFIIPTTGWTDTTESIKILASDGIENDLFGYAVGISNENLVIGSHGNDEKEAQSGAAYFYRIGPKIEILNQPNNQRDLCTDDNISYIVSGNNIDNYQWQMSDDNGSTYNNISDSDGFSGSQTATLSVSANKSINNNYFRCLLKNDVMIDSSNNALLSLETTKPTITCAGDVQKELASGSTYTVIGTEIDPTETADNCGIASVTNNFNDAATLDGADFPSGTTTIIWTVTDYAGNVNTCSYEITVNGGTGINLTTNDSFSLYPNPVSSALTIQSNSTIQSIQIMSATGTVMHSEIVGNTEAKIDLQEIQSGIYLIRINTLEGSMIKRIIKQ